MPRRLFDPPLAAGSERPALAPLLAALLAALALPPSLLRTVLASTAATLFEALPFVLFAAFVPTRRFSRILPLAACGCGSSVPAALAVPALVLCWLNFGPWVTLARGGAALGSLGFRRRRHAGDLGPHDPLAELSRLAAGACLATFVLEAASGFARTVGGHALQFDGHTPWLWRDLGVALQFGLGALAGALAPCGTAGIAAAAAFRTSSPAAAAGLLTTSGLVGFVVRRRPSRPPQPAPRGPAIYLCLALAPLWLWVQGGRGFLSPHLVPLLPLGAALAGFAAVRPAATAARFAAALPAVLFAALLFGSPAPDGDGPASLPAGLYAGRAVRFVGRLEPGGRDVARAAMLCCRADAQTLRLSLDRRIARPAGTWVEVAGHVIASPAGLTLHLEHARLVTPPADSFLYL
jgi:hypothetical protein